MSEVLYRKEGHIAYVSLNRPERRNAINRNMTRELAKVWVDFRDDPDCWVGILRGEGKSFCAGADIGELERGKWQFRKSLMYGDERVGFSSYGIWKPIIATVQGHAYGAGLVLALEADILIASEDALFGIPESKVNIPFLFAPFIYDFVPRPIANELMFTGHPIDAKRAYQLALVNRLVPGDELMVAAGKVAEDICLCGPLANWAAKELAFRCRSMDFNSALGLVEHIVTPICNGEDSIEGKRAFLEKRKPQWKLR